MNKIFKVMLNIDRRIIFVVIALSIIIPLFFTYEQEIHADRAAISFYETVKSLKDKKKKDIVVLVSGEYDPGTVPELSPMARAAFTQLLDMDAKIIIMGLVPMGPPLLMEQFNQLIKQEKYSNKKYGIDYVNLGYTVGNAVVIKGMVKDIKSKYPIDVNGTELDELPMMKKIRNFNDIDLIIDFSSMGGGAKQWIQFAKKTNDKTMDIVFGCTAVMAPDSYPYLNSKQIKGLLGGLKGAADYEALIEKPQNATKYIFAQSVAHVVIMIFILIGNIGFFLGRKKREGVK